MNYLGFNEKKLNSTVKELNNLLACYHIYYQNLRNFHWNVIGDNFFELHEKFEELYDDARVKIDEIAERILTLRQRPLSQLSEYLKISKVKEAEYAKRDRDMVYALLDNHKVLIECLRKTIKTADKAGDEGTIDMAGGFLKDLEKSSWMLDAWVSETSSIVVSK